MKPASEYLRLLQSLLPSGAAWNRDDGSTILEFLFAEADEFARIDERSEDLFTERDTRYSSELLDEHDLDLGLPDECSQIEQTISQRRITAHEKLTKIGRQDPAYFIELAASYGWTITITEFKPFWCGIGAAGDMCGCQEVIFYWCVFIEYSGAGELTYFTAGNSQANDSLAYIPGATLFDYGTRVDYFVCGSGVAGDSLAYIEGTESLICILNKYKPAHTLFFLDVFAPEFNRAFGLGFNSLDSDDTDYLEGEFGRGFGTAFDVYYGGGFSKDEFGIGFRSPA